MSADNLAMPLIRGSSRLAAGSTPRRIIHTMRLLLVLVVLVVAGSGPVRTPTAYATEQSPAASYGSMRPLISTPGVSTPARSCDIATWSACRSRGSSFESSRTS